MQPQQHMHQDHLPTAAETAQSAVIAQLPEELQSLLLRLGLHRTSSQLGCAVSDCRWLEAALNWRLETHAPLRQFL